MRTRHAILALSLTLTSLAAAQAAPNPEADFQNALNGGEAQIQAAAALVSIGEASNFSSAMESRVPSPTPNDPHWVVQNLQGQKQETKVWCWAAASRILMSAVVKDLPKQCEIVGRELGIDCCKSISLKCLVTADVSEALKKNGYNAVKAQPDFYKAVDSIKKGHPVAITHYYNQGTSYSNAHVDVAYAAYFKDNDYYLQLFDPYTGNILYWSKDYVKGNLQWINMTTLK